jgi:hypothetical protein
MLTGLLHAHSGLRYLVLVAGAAALVYALVGMLARRPYDRGMRITAATFVGLLHLQVLLGIALVLAGIFYGQLIGHIVLMLAAAAAAQTPVSMMRRRSAEERTYGPHAVGTALALVLIWAGLLAIGRGLFEAAFF